CRSGLPRTDPSPLTNNLNKGNTTATTLFTFGHGTADAGQITSLLQGAGVTQLVDVRSAPGSRHNPAATRQAMSQYLPEAGINYRWEPRLGGWRRATGDSPDVQLRNASFRSYAGHMRSAEFVTAIDDVVVAAAEQQVTLMCAETVWWRCHRRLIADYLTLARSVEV